MGKYLISKGFRVICYFDRRAEELVCIDGLSVFTIASAPYMCKDNINNCVIVCLQNIIQHTIVAKELYDNGYNNILFLSEGDNFNSKLSYKMIEKYNNFFSNFEEVTKIPCYSSIIIKYKEIVNKYDIILNENNNYVTIMVPVNLVFVERVENNVFHGKNICRFIPYFNLFRYLEGIDENCDIYLSFIKSKSPNINIKSYMSHRFKLFQMYERELSKGIKFFILSSPIANYENGKFYLTDGHHRVTYLITKNYNKVPITINKIDFKLWINKSLIYYEKFKNIFLNCPISHPYFSNCGSNELIVYRIFISMFNYIKNIKFTNFNFIEIDNYDGFFCRVFSRENIDKLVCIYDKINIVKVKYVNKILGINNIELYENSYEHYEIFDIAILSSDVCDVNNMLLMLNNCKFVFVEEQQVNNINLDWNYKKLTSYLKNNEFYRFGVYTSNCIGRVSNEYK